MSPKQAMLLKAARVYSCSLFAIAVILVCLCVFLQCSQLTGSMALAERLSDDVVFVSFLVGFASLALAKDRNVWKNEFKSCPVWWRFSVLVLMLYGCARYFAQVAFIRQGAHLADQSFIANSMSLFFVAAPLCVLYPVVFVSSVDKAEIARRMPVSIGLTAVVGLLFLAGRAGLPHAGR